METVLPALSGASSALDTVYSKVTRRIMPLLLFCYLVSYLDRVNVGFAKLQMATDLGLSDAAYGLGAGIFFFGYFIFEVPSNLILHRVGARVWIARIMITWGLVSAATMYVTSPGMFYAMRFLLGVAEAGFFPGVILYLTYWYPARRRARMTTLFMTAVALSGVVGGPVSGYILKTFDGAHGMHGWQWLYLLEGLPSIIAGVLVYLTLDDRIADAKWLHADERGLLEQNVRDEEAGKEHMSLGAVLTSPRVWLMCLIYFSFVVGLYGVGFWLPTLIKATGVADVFTIGMLSAVPYAAAVVAMIAIARSSDRHRERRWHLAVPAVIGMLGLVLAVTWAHQTTLAITALTLATMGILTAIPLFWSLPTAFLGGAAAAAGIALINSVGNLAGFLGPFVMGSLQQMTSSSSAGMYVLAAFMALGGLLALSLPKALVNK